MIETPKPLSELPQIPADKRQFSIGEAAEFCGVRPHVLRYWEQEFSCLNQIKRRGNRRCYTNEDVVLLRRIRTLLYDQGFTIQGARQQLNQQQTMAAIVQHTPIDPSVMNELQSIAELLDPGNLV